MPTDAPLDEVTDRFGKRPPQGQTPFDVRRLRLPAKPHGVSKTEASPQVTVISLRSNPPVETIRVIELVQKNRHVRIARSDRLRLERATADPRRPPGSRAECSGRRARRR